MATLPTQNVYSKMRDLRWSLKEKSIARRAFDRALHRELEATIQEAKQMAARFLRTRSETLLVHRRYREAHWTWEALLRHLHAITHIAASDQNHRIPAGDSEKICFCQETNASENCAKGHLVEVIRSQPVNQKIRGMTEKYVLGEAARDVITDTVYRRQKHPFLSPPATLDPEKRLSIFVQDTLRGSVLDSIRFFDQRRVVNLLDSLDSMDEGSRVANDQVLMTLVSACALHERFQLSA